APGHPRRPARRRAAARLRDAVGRRAVTRGVPRAPALRTARRPRRALLVRHVQRRHPVRRRRHRRRLPGPGAPRRPEFGLMAYEFKLPDLGEGLTEGEIARWLVSEGQEVAEDEPLVEIQTDKTTVEVPSPASGTVARILVREGEVVPVGTVL